MSYNVDYFQEFIRDFYALVGVLYETPFRRMTSNGLIKCGSSLYGEGREISLFYFDELPLNKPAIQRMNLPQEYTVDMLWRLIHKHLYGEKSEEKCLLELDNWLNDMYLYVSLNESENRASRGCDEAWELLNHGVKFFTYEKLHLCANLLGANLKAFIKAMPMKSYAHYIKLLRRLNGDPRAPYEPSTVL